MLLQNNQRVNEIHLEIHLGIHFWAPAEAKGDHSLIGIVNLTQEGQKHRLRQDESALIIWLIIDRLDANRLFP